MKSQLQSLLGLLIYVHKHVKPARAFFNRMLALLRSGHASQNIQLTPDFRRDLRWFSKFLPFYNGVSLYDHMPTDYTLEIDACLTGLVNILLAVRLFQAHWAGRKILIKCDNEAVVSVLMSGRTKDPHLGACAHNIWYVCALVDIDVHYVHIRGLDNRVADLSCWTGSGSDVSELHLYIQDPVWIPVDRRFLEIDPQL